MRVHFGIFDRVVGRKAWGVVVALVVFALTCAPIGAVVCHASDDVAGMSVEDALSILEGKPATTASPASDPAETLDTDPPMLRVASAPIFTPYVSIFSEANVFVGKESGVAKYQKFNIQPFYANIFSVDNYSAPSFGNTHLNSLVLFYDSYSFSDPCSYFRFHLSLENGSVIFNAESSNSIKLYFVSDDGYGLSCDLSFDATTKDFYCKIPSSYLTTDGYFYIEAKGYFRQESIKCNALDRFSDLSVNDFIIPTSSLPSSLSSSSLKDWVYLDRSKCRDFPETIPSASPDPSGGGTGGGTDGTPAPPATSDPALGTIDDSINKQMQQDQEQHEETKGLLGRIIDGITSIPSKIIDLLTDALKALFVPSDDFLDKQLQAFGDSFDAMGFLGYPLSRSIDFLTGLSDSGSSDFTFAGYIFMSGDNFIIPSYSLSIGGKSYKLWDNITWSYDGFFNYFPSEVKALLSMFIYLLGGLCVVSYALHMARKYFGVILSDNAVLSVFGSLDNTVLDAMVDDLSEEEQYELDWWRRQEKARLDHMELEGFRKSHRRRRRG